MNGEPLRLWIGEVLPEWLDYNGHMTEHRYLQVFGESSDALYASIGVDFENASEGAFFTLETHIRHVAEARVGTALRSETEILAYDDKRLHLYHRLLNADGKLLATAEHLSLHVAQARSVPASASMLERVNDIFQSQIALSMPNRTGSVLLKALANSRPS